MEKSTDFQKIYSLNWEYKTMIFHLIPNLFEYVNLEEKE